MDAIEDDRFAHELANARSKGDMDGFARVLSGRLRQMDKRARAANVRADNAESAKRISDAQNALLRAEIARLQASHPTPSRQESKGETP